MSEPRKRHVLVDVLLWDVGLALGGYYLCRALGADEYLSLLAATVLAAGRVGLVALRRRSFDGFAAVMCIVFGLGLVLSFATGDPRFLLALKSVTTGTLALILFGSCVVGRAAAFYVAKRFGAEDEQTVARWNALFASEPAFRRSYLVMTLVWGGALLVESAVRIPVIYLLPMDVAVSVSSVLLPGTIVGAVVWSSWYGKRGERRAVARQRDGAPRGASAQHVLDEVGGPPRSAS